MRATQRDSGWMQFSAGPKNVCPFITDPTAAQIAGTRILALTPRHSVRSPSMGAWRSG